METQQLAEYIEHKRDHWMKWNLVGFVLWQGLRLVQQYLVPGHYLALLLPLTLLGAGIWGVSLLKLTQLLQVKKANPALQAILNDELIVAHRWKAAGVGFGILLLMQVLIEVVSYFYPFSASLSAELSIFVGVVSALGAFLYWHR